MTADLTGTTEPGPDAHLLRSTAHLDLLAMDERAIPELQRIAMMPAVRRTWRTRGGYVAPQDWANLLLGQNLFECYARDRTNGRVVGYTELFDASTLDGYAHLSAFAHPDVWNTGMPVEQVIGALDLAFDRLPLRKVVAHLPAENVARLRGLHQVADHVGTLSEHLLIEGTYVDVSIFEITREAFGRAVDERLGAALRPIAAPATFGPGGGAGALADFDAWVDQVFAHPTEPPRLDELDSLHWVEVLDLVERALGRAVEPEALRGGESLADVRRFLADHAADTPPSRTRGAR